MQRCFDQSINQKKKISLPNYKNKVIVITVLQRIFIYIVVTNCHINLKSCYVQLDTYITTTKLCRKI